VQPPYLERVMRHEKENQMDKEQIIERLKAGHELHNRGTGWWLSAPKRRSGAADAVQVDSDLMNALEADGTLRIVMLTTSMRAELPEHGA
jgi:hypothetical protein